MKDFWKFGKGRPLWCTCKHQVCSRVWWCGHEMRTQFACYPARTPHSIHPSCDQQTAELLCHWEQEVHKWYYKSSFKSTYYNRKLRVNSLHSKESMKSELAPVQIPETQCIIPRARKSKLAIRRDDYIRNEVMVSRKATLGHTVVGFILGQLPQDEICVCETGSSS